jgi:hypothetical protein
MLIGYIIHWLPGKVKDIWEKAFTNMPMVMQALSVAVIIFLMYQMVSDTSKPFVYFQF